MVNEDRIDGIHWGMAMVPEAEDDSMLHQSDLNVTLREGILKGIPSASDSLLQDEQILTSTKVISAALSGRRLEVDSSIIVDSDIIIKMKHQLDNDAKVIRNKRTIGSVKSALKESVDTLDVFLEKALGAIEAWVEGTEKIDSYPVPIETIELVAHHASEIAEGDRLVRRINELNTSIEELRRHLE